MTALSNSFVISIHFSSGSSVESADGLGSTILAFSFKGKRKSSTQRRALIVQASYSDGGRPSSASIFVGGFVLGGLIVGTLCCVYAPQICKALTGTDKKDLMKKLPKFIYDEEKALEAEAAWIKCACFSDILVEFQACLISMDGMLIRQVSKFSQKNAIIFVKVRKSYHELSVSTYLSY